jgi:hypothetical protein
MYQKLFGPLVAAFLTLAGLAAVVGSDDIPTKVSLQTILPGEGLKGCQIGGTTADAKVLFGNPSKLEGSYVIFTDKGIDLLLKDDKIKGIFFYFRDRDHKPFAGKTDKGIGRDSTMEDVQKAYGKPDRIGESVVSEFGSNPGAVEHRLPYAKLRISFAFHDRKLANVRVWAADE